MRLALSRKPETAYFASHMKYTNASAGKTKITLRQVVHSLQKVP